MTYLHSSGKDFPDRAQWPRLLMAVPAAELQQVAATLSADLAVEDMQLPQSGLGLLRLKDGALGEQYFCGEIPLARSRVRVSDRASSAEGAAMILDDRSDVARNIAIIDAVLSGKLEGHERVMPLLRAGAHCIGQQSAERRAMLASTLVNFSLFGTEEDDV